MKSGKIFAGVAVALDFNAAATDFFTGAVKTAVLFEAETVVQLRTPVAGVIANSISEINRPSEILADNGANPTTFPQASSIHFSNQGNNTAGVPCDATTAWVARSR
jgi:hypothetical protein